MLDCPRSHRAVEDARGRGRRFRLATHGASLLTAVFVLLQSASPDRVHAADISWSNAAGGAWNNPANWTGGAVPGSSDRAFITLAGTYTVTLDVSPSVTAIFVGAGSGQQTLFGSGRTLTVTDSVSVSPSGALDLTNSTVIGRLADRALVVARRNCTFSGQTNVELGATLRVLGASGGSAALTVGPVANRGTIELTTIDGNFQSTLTGAGPVTISAGGVLRTLTGTGGERHLAAPMVNRGTVTLDFPLYLDNGGLSQLNDVGSTIDVGNADLVLTQNGGSSFTNQGTVTIGSGRVFSVNAGTFANSGTLAGAGTLVISNATVNGSLSAAASLLVDITTCTVNAAVTNQGLMVIHRINTFNGTVTNASGATLRNLGGSGNSAILTLSSTVTNQGTLELSSAGGNFQSNLQGNGTLTNQAGGVLVAKVGSGGERHLALPTTNQGTVTIENTLYLDNAGSQLNAAGGTYEVSGADLVVTQSPGSASFNNQGTINVATGRACSFSGGSFTNTGALSGGGSFSLTSLTASLNTALTFTLASVSVTSSTLNIPQGLDNEASTTLTLNSVTVNGAMTNHGVLVTRRNVTLNGSMTNETGSTLRVLGASGGSANLIIGPVTNRGALELTTIDGNFQSTISGNGTLTNVAGSTFRVLPGTGGERHLQAAMVNQGTMTVEYGFYLDNGTKTQLNDVGGTISLTTGDIVLSQSGAGSFTNRGTLSVGAGRTFSISGGTFLNDVAGMIKGSGTISSSGPDITNAGTISPGASPGKLTFNGKVVQSASGRIRIEVSGTQPILEYDVLSCSGQLVLGGTLQIAVLGGFVPPAGSSYVAIKYGTHTGIFAALDGADLGGGLQFAPTYTDTAIILSTGPLAITAVTSNHGGNSGIVSTVIHGVGFFNGLTAHLSLGAQQIPAQITGVSPYGTAFAATFDLTGAAVGAWDLVVQGTGGGTVTLPGGFTVEAPKAPKVTAWIVGSPIVRFGSTAYYDIICTNEGNTDAFTVPLWIGGIPAGSPWTLSPPDSNPPVFSAPFDYSNAPSSFGTASDSLVALLLMRVPAGGSLQYRLSVHPSTTANFPLTVWTQRPWVSPAPTLGTSAILEETPDTEMIDCLLSLVDFVLSCAGLAPGENCLIGLIDAFVASMASAAHTGFDVNVVHPGQNGKNATSIIKCMAGGILGELAVKCGSEVILPLKIYQVLECGYNLFEAIHECDVAVQHESETSLTVAIATSHDPNDKSGPTGVGLAQYVRKNTPIPYVIHFENLSTATAPAAEVVVRDTLDTTKFDLSTVSLGPIQFGDHFFAPAPGSTSSLGTVDLRPAMNLVVKIDARLDPGTGVITWRLSSIDPNTGAPPTDPLAGFLPPNVVQPAGEGSVIYTVKPLAGITTGQQIGNRASIVFDANAAILTPLWANTIDATAPATAVAPLPAVTQTRAFTVSWGGSDAESHVKDFTILRSMDGGPDSVWLRNVTETSAMFIEGQAGHTYAFSSIARDSAGNEEAVPAEHDAQTTISIDVGVGPTPRVPIFALYGGRPNPTTGRAQILFELANGSAAALDLYDVAGRRVVHRDVGGLGPGSHSINLGESAPIPAGFYFVRLHQGRASAIKTIVVSR